MVKASVAADEDAGPSSACTCILFPKLGSTTFLAMYSDVFLWTIILRFRTLKRLFLALAGRLSHTRFHPPDQPAPAIANGPTEQHVRRSVPAHARLGKPRLADAKKLGRLLRRKQPLKVAVGLGARVRLPDWTIVSSGGSARSASLISRDIGLRLISLSGTMEIFFKHGLPGQKYWRPWRAKLCPVIIAAIVAGIYRSGWGDFRPASRGTCLSALRNMASVM